MTQHSKQEDRRLRDAMLEALPRLQRFARSLTGNRHDAEDLLQSTVERVLERGVPGGVDVPRWMFKVCRNLWIDEVRAHSVRRRAAARPELADEGVVGGEAAVIEALTLQEVDRAMSRLPDEQRAVLALVAVEGFSYREAADVLEVPIGTVMSRMARGRAALASCFEDQRREVSGAQKLETGHE